jgi:hypothetical protein
VVRHCPRPTAVEATCAAFALATLPQAHHVRPTALGMDAATARIARMQVGGFGEAERLLYAEAGRLAVHGWHALSVWRASLARARLEPTASQPKPPYDEAAVARLEEALDAATTRLLSSLEGNEHTPEAASIVSALRDALLVTDGGVRGPLVRLGRRDANVVARVAQAVRRAQGPQAKASAHVLLAVLVTGLAPR